MSLLSQLKGYRTLIVNGLVLVTAILASIGAIPNPMDGNEAVAIADSAEAVANAAENVQDSGAVTAGVLAVYAVVNIFMRVMTSTPAGKKA